MGKKILTLCIVLLAAAILVAPVLAKGPINAEDKNDIPNAEIIVGGASVLDLTPPSEVTNRWFGANNIHVIVKPADQFYNPTEIEFNEFTVGMWFMEVYRGKWVKMTQAGYEALFTMFGLPVPDIPPEGVYAWGAKIYT